MSPLSVSLSTSLCTGSLASVTVPRTISEKSLFLSAKCL